MNEAGKTDKPRPFAVPLDTFGENFERTFGRPNAQDDDVESTAEDGPGEERTDRGQD